MKNQPRFENESCRVGKMKGKFEDKGQGIV